MMATKMIPINEIFGAVGYLAQLDLSSLQVRDNGTHLLTPKMIIRYAPGHMRKQENGARLNHLNIFIGST